MEKSVCEMLNEAKNKHGMTNAELAEKAGIPDGTLAKIMSGTTACSADNYIKLMNAMNEIPLSKSHEGILHYGSNSHCEKCPALESSRDSYKHSFDELKRIMRFSLIWLCIVTLFAMLMTGGVFWLAARHITLSAQYQELLDDLTHK